ncbi:bactofilin family protein [Persephonella sp.]|nr:polymer-forming cytoskeletal protein [Aquificota bacterium]
MGIFDKRDNGQPPANSGGTTIISEGSTIKGELKFSGSVHIDGEVEGNIFCEKIVTVGKKGRVKGTVRSDKVIVKGYIEGNIDADSIEVLSGGRITGEIAYNEIMVEPKGTLEGTAKLKTGKIKKIEVQQENEAVR